MKNRKFRLFPSTIAASFILLAPALHADAITWDAGGGDNKWSTVGNWSDGASPTGDDITFDATGTAASGTTNTVSASESINSLSYNFEDAANQHTTEISAGQALAVAGDFSVLTGTAPAAPTNVNFTGTTGTLSVTGTNFQLANPTVSTTNSTTSVDMSALGTLTANLTGVTSLFRVGTSSGFSGVSTGNNVTLKLAANSTITANTVGVSDNSNFGGVQKMLLGSGATSISTNNFNVGNTSGGRCGGEVSFNTGTGTLLLRGLAGGTSAVTTMNMVNSAVNSTANVASVVNLASHSVDAKIGTLNMAIRTGNTGTNTNANLILSESTLSFDQGILDVGTANMGKNGNAGLLGKIAATINIGGGTANFGAVNMADNSTGSTGGTTTATLNLTGGTTTVDGDIVKLGTTNATGTVLLNGGTLDMTNGNIGSSTNPVSLNLQAGTLKNVATFNGGGLMTKTSAGVLTLSGANTFTGGFTISTGEVILTESGSLGVGPKTLNPQVNGYFTLDGTAGNISLASNLSFTTAGLSIKNVAGANVINGSISIIAGSGITEATSDGGSLDLAGSISNGTALNRTLQLSGSSAGANTVSGLISDGGAVIGLTKGGAGTWTLTNNANSFTGNVNVNDGQLKITKSGALGTGTKNINFTLDGYLALDGSAGAVTLSSGKTLRTAGPALLNIAGDNVISSPIAIIGGAAFTQVTSDAGSLDLAGGVSSEITTEYRRLELVGTSTGANTISGPITDGNARVDILKNGAGNWALTNASNTYTGNTSVVEGILSVSTPNFADTSTVSIGSLANPAIGFLNLPNAGDDTVASLVIDGVVQAAGKTYGNASSILPVIATSAITGPGTITVPSAGTPYSIWADTFLPGDDVSDPDGDNDNDGLVNQQEFAFGLSPIDGSSVNPILVQLDKTAGTFTYQRRADTGLTYRILTSTTLEANSWIEDGAATLGQSATPSGDNETVVVTLTGAPLAATKLFVRVAAD